MTNPEPPTTEQEASALATDFTQTARALFAAGGGQDTLTEVVRLAVATVEGCDFAGVLLLDQEVVSPPAHTDRLVGELESIQHHSGEGPCLDAVAQEAVFYAEDLTEDTRWPHFGPQAAAAGVRSLLAVPLSANGALGAFTLYAQYPHAFGVLDRARALLLANLASLAFVSARSHEDEEHRAANLHAALATREMIGQAQGILMERERVTADQAFDILRRASQHLNIKLREVAQTLVETGEQPDTGPRRDLTHPPRGTSQ